MILGLRLSLPANGGYLALTAACVALTWFAGVWAARIDLAVLHGETPRARTDRSSRAERAALSRPAEDEASSVPATRQARRTEGRERYEQHG